MEYMKCLNCNQNIPDDSIFCPFCGGNIQELKEKLEKERAESNQCIISVENGEFARAYNGDATLKRAFLFIEDGEFNRADAYLESILDQDPENAQAYLGKLMIDLRVNLQEELGNLTTPFESNKNYIKAVRFADEELKSKLNNYIKIINNRNENGIYTRAKNAMSAANTESAYKEAAALFESISEYQDSSALAQSCYEKAEIARKEAEKSAKQDENITIIVMTIFCAIIAFILVLNTVII